ncbi:hypothetical protein CANCADRAFT_1203 [Tortispora caseinolytica NRRL Y-17796]|uniref:Protein BZZ1 n=1 Tax=Tortispora caseinolytica NRRL Y-17796 TaxID=767744 RepID=A0A1E4TLI4_9ASCO|nr:hypothetical protein CANCADRAFT_1203 [Tortispora caseinolytica NRRL Y-17796]
MASEEVSFGADLFDGFKPVNKWIGHHIAWLDDVQSFYRERSALEKEYAQKLGGLAKKYIEKKVKRSPVLSVGENPTTTPGSLESASMVTWNEILLRTENIAKEHDRLSSEFQLQVADQIRGFAVRHEDYRKMYEMYYDKLVEERDDFYHILKKAKASYDSACQSTENARSKQSRSFDLNKSKTAKNLEKAKDEMNNQKNNYLIWLNICNRIKDKYYYIDLPTLLNEMQEFSENRVRRVNKFWKTADALEVSCLDRCKGHLAKSDEMIDRNEPWLDSAMFSKHNTGTWNEPPDFVYEPSAIWHEDEEMVVDDGSKVILRNRVSNSYKRLEDLRAKISDTRANIETLKEKKQKCLEDPKAGSYEETLNRIITTQTGLIKVDNQRVSAEVEIEVVEMAVGDIAQGTHPHSFKTKSFTVPTSCDFCKDMIWGLNRHGLTCEACKINVHGKCELKVAPYCPGQKVKRSKKGVQELSGGDDLAIAPAIGGSPGGASTQGRVRAIYAYTAQGPGELSMKDGDLLTIVDEDDGSGWIVVTNGKKEGVVPSTYVKRVGQAARSLSISSSIDTQSSGKKKGPAVAPRRGAKKLRYAVALYDYNPRTELELAIHAGDRIVVISEDAGDGWTEGELNGKTGSFPTNYVEFE